MNFWDCNKKVAFGLRVHQKHFIADAKRTKWMMESPPFSAIPGHSAFSTTKIDFTKTNFRFEPNLFHISPKLISYLTQRFHISLSMQKEQSEWKTFEPFLAREKNPHSENHNIVLWLLSSEIFSLKFFLFPGKNVCWVPSILNLKRQFEIIEVPGSTLQ